jgi:membrane-associated protease RseP (regulator of RpoE activity)
MNNQIRSLKCPQCGLTHITSAQGTCPNCGRFVAIAQPRKSKTLALIVASAVILLCAGVVVVFTKTGHQEVEQPGTASQQLVNVSSQLPPEQPVSDYPLVGLSITSIDDGSPAMMAGLQVGDIVVQYGETKVLDTASFFAAQEAYAKTPSSNIVLGVVRNGSRINASVPSGRIGFFSEENNPVMLQFYVLMNNIAVQEQLPPEQFEQMKRDGREIESRQSMVKKAEQLILYDDRVVLI